MNLLKRLTNRIMYRLFGATPYKEDKLKPDPTVRTIIPKGYDPNNNNLFEILLDHDKR